MYLAYIDESGSTGDVARGASKSYTLGCVLVRAARWVTTLESLVAYRRHVTAQFGLVARAEIRANYLLQNGGPFRDLALSERARHALYRGMLRLCSKIELKVLAVVIRKELLPQTDPHEMAWALLFQRLERLTTAENVQAIVFHDEGDDARIRSVARRIREVGFDASVVPPGQTGLRFRGLVDDPVSRRSHESLLVQLADLVAYAAFRRVFPPPPRAVHIVPQSMWDELGDAALGDPVDDDDLSPGIVAWPQRGKIEEPPGGGSEGRPAPDIGPAKSSTVRIANCPADSKAPELLW